MWRLFYEDSDSIVGIIRNSKSLQLSVACISGSSCLVVLPKIFDERMSGAGSFVAILWSTSYKVLIH